MRLQHLEIERDEQVRFAFREIVGRETVARHKCRIVRVGQPVRFLHSIGVDAGERLRRHVDEDGDVLLHEFGFGLLVDPRQPLSQLRLRLREVRPDAA